MFSARGSPSAKHLFSVIAELQKQEGIYFALKVVRGS
jgi:hypothetical protein